MNPLLLKFDTTPFSEINDEHFLPAIKDLIAVNKKEIATIVDAEEAIRIMSERLHHISIYDLANVAKSIGLDIEYNNDAQFIVWR